MRAALSAYAPDDLTEGELEQALAWCARRCPQVVAEVEEQRDEGKRPDEEGDADAGKDLRRDFDDAESATAHGARSGDGDDDTGPDDEVVIADQPTPIDHEDDSLLLLLHRRLRGPLMAARQREALEFEHILVDEAQDLSPVELSVVMATTSPQRSVTLAGDVAQRLHMDNGFRAGPRSWGSSGCRTWRSSRSSSATAPPHEIIEFAHQALGPLAPAEMGKTTRGGAPVELFRFAHSGDAVGFLASRCAIWRGPSREPRSRSSRVTPSRRICTVEGLINAEVPNVRRIADQDFPFKPGVDVTDVRQVKGLEFDYVVLLEVNTATYPESDEARHLMHIAATRAAHQLWLTCTGTPSGLVPALLRERGY